MAYLTTCSDIPSCIVNAGGPKYHPRIYERSIHLRAYGGACKDTPRLRAQASGSQPGVSHSRLVDPLSEFL